MIELGKCFIINYRCHIYINLLKYMERGNYEIFEDKSLMYLIIMSKNIEEKLPLIPNIMENNVN